MTQSSNSRLSISNATNKLDSYFASQSKRTKPYEYADEKLDDSQEDQMFSDWSSESDDQVSLTIQSHR